MPQFISCGRRHLVYGLKVRKDVRVAGEAISLGGVDRIRCTAKDSSFTVGDILEEPEPGKRGTQMLQQAIIRFGM